ncbi:hypothetical protein EBQ26_03615 [Allofranklinella schreckenbergeri]|uniref:Uncharacterized protein n=1 Tax=Allofranklinella schreckenbergeri TaxID=1076744 RepID=A0A3M6QB14_9BURK|nr:hypothetical protein [Allofranklinella schreckenbergeri]RMX00157.1 hypothetical protein EBQ26_03615 [Allofranklinella schreckenbergeri]
MSKWLILALVVGVLVWRWSQRRTARMAPPTVRAGAAPQPIAMVPCEVCGVLMDARLAIRSPTGHLCHTHRHGAHPPDAS